VARIVRMPDLEELPEGTVRDFVGLLFHLYRSARRPSLRDISEQIRRDDSLSGTASTETIRRMLRGTTVPSNWGTVEAVYLTLCKLGVLDPWGVVEWNGQGDTIHRYVQRLWHAALDDPTGPSRRPRRPAEDPWAVEAEERSGSSWADAPEDSDVVATSDEPPF
jgi:hypothetical protein